MTLRSRTARIRREGWFARGGMGPFFGISFDRREGRGESEVRGEVGDGSWGNREGGEGTRH